MKDNNLFFIVGRGRSGTDLLQRLLNTNPSVCIPPESTVLALLYSKYKDKKNWTSKQTKSFCKDAFLDEKLTLWWKLEYSKTEKYLLDKKPINFHEAVYYLYEFYANLSGKENTIIGDKNPANSLYIDEMKSIYSRAKFIVVVRNPIDNVFSFTNVSFDSNNPKILAHRWNYYNEQILKSSQQNPSQFHIVKFEELIENTEKVLSGVAQFLAIENSFELEKKEKGEQVWQKNLDKKINSHNINKGEKGLKKLEKSYVNAVCLVVANQFGYNIYTESKAKTSVIAWFFNRFEKYFIRLPLYLSSSILKFYRRKSKIIVDN